MELKILGSNSDGNCYIFTDSNWFSLIVEAGVHISEIDKALDFDYSKVVGGVISHSHGDHAKSAFHLLANGVNLFCSSGCADVIGVDYRGILKADNAKTIGSFKVYPFDICHDAPEPFGFVINHSEMGYTLFLTDTYILHNNFQGLNNIIIEANYCENIIEQRPIQHKDRVIENHMSIQTTLKTLGRMDLSQVNNIVLIHLSDGNSNSVEFKTKVENQTCKTVHIAKKGMAIPFGKTPF